MSCVLIVLEYLNIVERGLVLHMLELLWTKLVELRRCQSKQAILIPSVNHIAREMIHAVCSYYICTFFTCMD